MEVPSLYNSFCDTQNVTYEHRVYNPETLNWCPVPGGGADALLFAGLAVFCSCALYSKLSAVWVLLAGAVFQLLSFYFNLNHFSNALTIWLGMHPSTMFFQIFLPPLLLDSAVRVDFFLFKKMAAHCFLFAFVNVLVSTLAFIPLLLYGLDLGSAGWRPVDAALFGAMLGSTDAVAVTAILKAGGAPELLAVLLESESLFNDASSVVLFEIFLHIGLKSSGDQVSLQKLLWHILQLISWLAVSGSLAGLAMGFITRLLLKLLHRRHVPPPVEVAVSLAGAYTVYLCTEYYVHGSGVIAVVVYGLHGASSFLWGFSSKGMRQQSFFRFWDVVSFVTNGIVFFFVGASVVNFLLSLTGELFKDGYAAAVVLTAKCLPAIMVAMFGFRWLLMTLEAPLLSLVGPALNWKEVLFSTLGGLRGGLALILAQTVLAAHGATQDPQVKVVHAQMVIWVAVVVLFTLTVNAPALGPLMSALGLNKTTAAQRHLHRRAYATLAHFTHRTIADLQADDDEMLRGVDWTAVESNADMDHAIKKVLRSEKPEERQLGLKPLTPSNGSSARQTSSLLNVSADVQEGFNRSHNLDEPIVLTRSSLARSSATFRALTAPLLGRQYTAKERYTTGDDDESETSDNAPQVADLEAGDLQGMPRVVAQNASEAVFIASRLQQQEEQLAQHAADNADGPLLAHVHMEDSDTAGPQGIIGYSDSTGALDADQTDETNGVNDAADDKWHSSSAATSAAVAEAAPAAQEAAADDAGAANGGNGRPAYKQLYPLIAVRMTDAMATLTASTQYTMIGAFGQMHSAALHAHRHPVSAAAGTMNTSNAFVSHYAAGKVRNGSFGTDRPRSFISAAHAAAAATGTPRASFGGSSTGSGSRAATGQPRLSEALCRRGGGQHGTSARNSVQIMQSVWNQHVHQTQPDTLGPSRLGVGNDRSAAAGAAGQAASLVMPASIALALPDTSSAMYGAAAGIGSIGESTMVDAGRLLQGLDTMSDVSTEDEDATQEEYLEECRVSLLAGLKRHFRFKAAEGLLSETSLRLLEYGCDTSLYNANKPLDLWKTIGGDIRRRGLTSLTAAAHLQLRKYQAALLRASSGGVGWLSWLLQKPLGCTSIMLRNRLGVAALTVLEVALELWLALTASPQARMTRNGTSLASAMLAEELKQQADVVWRFIIDRQIEAPDEFATLQTHRVQLAVARRQLAFVEQLAEVGAVEEAAAEALQELVERQLNRLERRGPSWTSPSLADVLRRQPFLTNQSEGMLLWLRAYGELKTYSPGQCIVPRRRPGPPGIFIVLSGLIRVEAVRCGQRVTHFVGVGGSVGFVSSIVSQELPGIVLVAAYAQGNTLGKGPMVLHIPMRLLATIKQRAAAALPSPQQQQQHPTATSFGDTGGVTRYSLGGPPDDRSAANLNATAFAQLLLNMHRQAGVMMLDKMGVSVVQRIAEHVEATVQAIFESVSQLPSRKAHAKLQRLLEAALGGSNSPAAVALGAEYASGSSTAAEVVSSNSALAETAMQLVLERAQTAAAMLRGLLHSADLVTMAPGQQITQGSSMLLMLGCLRVNNSGTFHVGTHPETAGSIPSTMHSGSTPVAAAGISGGSGGSSSSLALRQFTGPAVLAWGPELFEQIQDRYQQTGLAYTAGPQGALLLVVPSDSSSSSSGSEAGDQADSDVGPVQQQGLQNEATGQGRQGRRLDRLSSLLPLHEIAASTVGPEQDT